MWLDEVIFGLVQFIGLTYVKQTLTPLLISHKSIMMFGFVSPLI